MIAADGSKGATTTSTGRPRSRRYQKISGTAPPSVARSTSRIGLWLAVESVAVGLSPLVTFFVLRLQAMAPVELPDPSMHTIYILDPSQMFSRYAAAFAPSARMREGAQAGFLVIARLFYLGFGAVGGFFATRYFFALIAVVPAYVLMRRLYGIPAAVMTVLVLLSCPVIITAWGTDYPDSAVVSYVAGAVACLAMPSRGWAKRAWTATAVVLLSLASMVARHRGRALSHDDIALRAGPDSSRPRPGSRRHSWQ